ncbi:MAG: TraB/GumN family protein [Aestuariivirgaceae bacterium]
MQLNAPVKVVMALVLVIAAALVSPLPANAQGTAACGGQDLIGDLESGQPALFRQIEDQAAQTRNGQSVLWRIKASGERAASYLFGTIHLSDERVAKLGGALQTALDEVNTVALEIVGAGDQQAMQLAIAKHPELIMLPGSDTLWELVGEADRPEVLEELGALGIQRGQAAKLQPWLPALMLSISTCETQRRQAGHVVLDQAIEAYAKERGIRLVGLETPVEQFAAMSSMPLKSQTLFLTDAARNRERVDDLNETLIKLYLNSRITWFFPFAKAMAGSEASAARSAAEAGFMETLIDKRNVKMAERAAPLLEAGGALIAVGALHLPGETGLVTLLRAQGYDISPVE